MSATAPASVVDAATTHASVSDDYDGNARPAGAAADMGASERNASPPAPTAPSAPTNCGASAQAGLQISVTWTDASNNEDGFRLERSVSGGAFATLTTLGAGVTSYLDTGLTDGTQYTYRVIASNTVGDSAPSNSGSATAIVGAPVGGGTGGTSGGGGGCSAGETGGVLLLVLAAASLALRRKRVA